MFFSYLSRVFMLLLLSVVLVACGGTTPPATNDDDTSPAASGQTSSPLGGSYSVNITGDDETSLEGGTIVFTYFDGAGITSESNELLIYAGSMSEELRQITISFSPDLGPGTYTMIDITANIAGDDARDVSASYSVFISDESIEEMQDYEYGQNLEGSFTIDSIGDTISGSFNFTADSIEFDDAGAEVRRSIRAEGSFSDVPFISD